MVRGVVSIAIAVIFLLSYLRYFEHRSLYFPDREIELVPSSAGLSYEDVYLDTDDGVKLNAWFIPAEGSKYTLLFLHGNAGNISHRMEKILILNSLGLDIFIFDYRGYGRSKGRPSEKGLYIDAQAAYDHLISRKNISPERIIIYGESLGGAVAIDLALQRKVKAIITESTFSSIEDIAKTIYPILPGFLIAPKFDSLKKIKDIKIPKLIMHSKDDSIIPFGQSLKLYNDAPEPKKHFELKGEHNTCHLESRELYISGIREFINTL